MTLQRNCLVAAVVLACIGTAGAQTTTSNFSGFELGAGLGFQSNRVDYQGFLNGKSSKATDTVPFLQASYGLPVAADWVVTLGGRYDLATSKYGTTTYPTGSNTVTSKYSDNVSLFVAPGYVISPDVMVYGKLCYSRTTGEFKDTGAPDGTTKHSGTGLGVGVAVALSHNVTARAELSRVRYSRESGNLSTGKPSSKELSFSLGYRFH